MNSLTVLMGAHTQLQSIEDDIRSSRIALIQHHKRQQCDLTSESFTTIWRRYTQLVHQHKHETVKFNELISNCINDALEEGPSAPNHYLGEPQSVPVTNNVATFPAFSVEALPKKQLQCELPSPRIPSTARLQLQLHAPE